MRLREVLRRPWTSADAKDATGPAPVVLPYALQVVHSADLDVHLAGVARPPASKPPWLATPWDRHSRARRRQPSALARVLLDLHPAFAGSPPENRHWMEVEQAEALALEWQGAWFDAAGAREWLVVHPLITPLRARDLVNAGVAPRDLARAQGQDQAQDQIIDLTVRSPDEPRAQRPASAVRSR